MNTTDPMNTSSKDTAPDATGQTGRADLRLDRNEGAAPPPELLDALGAVTARDLARYPDPADAIGATERAWAERVGVDPARVVLTTGGDGAIDLFFGLFGEAGARAVFAAPTFEPREEPIEKPREEPSENRRGIITRFAASRRPERRSPKRTSTGETSSEPHADDGRSARTGQRIR